MTLMKQKIVIEVSMPDDKCRKKAKKIVALTEGLISMAVEADKNKIIIIGIGLDAAILATTLRKKVGRANIVTIEEVKSPEKIKEEEAAKKQKEEAAAAAAAAKKRMEEEQAAINKLVPWSYSHQHNYTPPVPFHGYDVVQYGAPSYPNSWFSW